MTEKEYVALIAKMMRMIAEMVNDMPDADKRSEATERASWHQRCLAQAYSCLSEARGCGATKLHFSVGGRMVDFTPRDTE